MNNFAFQNPTKIYFGKNQLTPKWMRYVLNKDASVAKDFERFGFNVMHIEDQKDVIKNASLAIDTFQAFIIEKLHLPATFEEAGLDTIDIEVLADHALKGAKSMPRAYRELTREDCIAVYEMCK